MTETKTAAPTATAALPSCPYQGLMPFSTADADFFYGRDADSRLIVDNLRAYRLSLLYGPSGVGKSSVLQAGAVRMVGDENESDLRLYGRSDTAVAYCNVWRDDPAATLAHVLGQALSTVLGAEAKVQFESFDGDGVARTADSLNCDLLVILDQFEEYFLYHHADSDEFARELAKMAAPDSRVSLLISIREDAVAKLDSFEAALPGLFENTLRLDHLDRDSGREAIVGPLEHFNELVPANAQRQIEPPLVEKLLDQVQAGRVHVATMNPAVGHAGDDGDTARIETPYLQLVLMRLWEVEAAAGSGVLRVATLDSLGGSESIVRAHLDRVVSEFEGDDRRMMSDAFGHLVTPSGSKIAHTAGDLAALTGHDPEAMRRLLQRLCEGDQRILRELPPPVEDPQGESRYEVFHDVLALAVLDWRRRYLLDAEADARNAVVIAQKAEAEIEAEQTHRRLRATRAALAVMAVLLVASVVLGALYVRSHGQANTATALANQRALLAQTNELLTNDPPAALSHTIQAWNLGRTADAEVALRQAIESASEKVILTLGSPAVFTAFVDNDSQIVTVTEDGHVARWDAASGDLLGRNVEAFPTDEGSRVISAAISTDESHVIVGTDSGEAISVPTDGSEPVPLSTEQGQVHVYVDTPARSSRNVVLTYATGGSAQLWNPDSGRQVRTFGNSSSFITAAAIDRSGTEVVTWDYLTHALTKWNAVTGRSEAATSYDSDFVYPLAFSPESGNPVVLGDAEHQKILTWSGFGEPTEVADAGDIAHLFTSFQFFNNGSRVLVAQDKQAVAYGLNGSGWKSFTPASDDWVNDTAISKDYVTATAGNNGEIQLVYGVSRGDQQPVWLLHGHNGPVTRVTFSDDGQTLLSAGRDGTVRLWQLPQREVLQTDFDWILSGRFTPNGHEVVTVSARGELKFFSTKTGKLLHYFPLETRGDEFVQSVDPSPQGDAAVVATGRYSLPWIAATDPGSQPTYETPDESVQLGRVRWNPDAQEHLIVGGTYDNRLIAWDDSNGQIRWDVSLGDSSYMVTDLEFSYDGSVLATVSDDGQLRVINPETGEVTRAMDAGNANSVALSADGHWVATAGADDQVVRVWDLEGSSSDPVQVYTEPQGTLAEVAFSRDAAATHVAVVGSAGLTYIWDRESGLLLGALRQHGGAVNAVSFDPSDPNRVLTTSDDGTSAIYSCSSCSWTQDQLLAKAEELLPSQVQAP